MNQIILQAYFPTDIGSYPKDEAPLLLVFMDMTANIPCHSEYKCDSKMTKQTHLVRIRIQTYFSSRQHLQETTRGPMLSVFLT